MERDFCATWGDFLKIQNDPERRIISTEIIDVGEVEGKPHPGYIAVTHQLLKEPAGRKSSIIIVSYSMNPCKGYHVNGKPFQATFTSAYGRILLNDVLDKYADQAVYADTGKFPRASRPWRAHLLLSCAESRPQCIYEPFSGQTNLWISVCDGLLLVQTIFSRFGVPAPSTR